MKATAQLCLPGCGVGLVAMKGAKETASEVSGSATPPSVSTRGSSSDLLPDEQMEEGLRTILPGPSDGKLGRKSGGKKSLGQKKSHRKGARKSKSISDLLEERRQEVQSSQHEWWTYKFAKVVSWVVLGLFTAASVLLVALWARHEHEESYVVTLFVMAIAAMAYFAKVTGMGEAQIRGKTIPVIRYIDWIATTPLMLYELCTIGGAEKHTIIIVIGSDILMLVGGIVSAMIVPKGKVMQKYAWFGISIFFYILMVVALEVDVSYGTVLERPPDVQRLFKQLSWLTVISWTGYPIVVLLGRAHAGLISKGMEDALLCILDCISKIGMEFFVVFTCSAHGAQCHAHGSEPLEGGHHGLDGHH
ncbi:aop3 [Symbiodinium natans]|uniref:Aop3 protein n=1 Tax=Symbiodinium natans TaxID=878477 RepID=A0A812RXI0_9DINO|nr:aop3 [Symbiodinium natans]